MNQFRVLISRSPSGATQPRLTSGKAALARLTLGVLGCLALGCGDDGGSGGETGDETDATSTTSTTSTTGSTTTGSSTTGSGSTTAEETGSSGSSGPGTTGATTDASESSGSSGSTGDETTGGLVGECVFHAMCPSGYCLTYQDSPPDPESVCAEPPAGGVTRLTGTVYDFESLAPVADLTFRVVAAAEALSDPLGAAAILSPETDALGRFDVSSNEPLTAVLGVLSLAEAEGYALTGNGLAQSPYGPGNIIHDVFVVPEASLSAWSEALVEDVEFQSFLPLGTNGGVVGLVRDGLSGEPLAGATISASVPANEVIRYLDDQGGFTASATNDSGIFVIGGIPTVAQFNAALDGTPVPGVATGGSALGAIFVMNFIVVQ